MNKINYSFIYFIYARQRHVDHHAPVFVATAGAVDSDLESMASLSIKNHYHKMLSQHVLITFCIYFTQKQVSRYEQFSVEKLNNVLYYLFVV